MAVVGIYKITSPSNKVYIGQSHNVRNRITYYKRCNIKSHPKVYQSFNEHGIESHKFEIIHELPKDISQTVLDNYEILYMASYRGCGIELMNVKEGGIRGANAPESRLKISLSNKGRISPRKGVTVSIETRRKQSDSHTGKTGILCPNSKKIICTKTNTIYHSIGEAALAIGMKRTTLSMKLVGTNRNNTTLKYL